MTLDENDENTQSGEAGAASQAPAGAPGPAFGLVFQAPDPQVVLPPRRAEREDDAADEQPSGARARDNDNGDPDGDDESGQRRRRRGGRGRRGGGQGDEGSDTSAQQDSDETDDSKGTSRSGRDGQSQDGSGGGRRRGGQGSSQKDQDGDASSSGSQGSRSAKDSGDFSDGQGGGSRGGRKAAGKSDDESGKNTKNSKNDKNGDTGNNDDGNGGADNSGDDDDSGDSGSSRRRRRRRRGGSGGDSDDPPGTTTRVREPRSARDEVTSIKGSTRLEAKKQRRREGREAGRRRTVITEAEFLARRESVDRTMVVRERDGRTQIGVLEDDVLVEHYVARDNEQASMAGNVYLGRVQNVLPSMEAAFIDIGRGRNAVLYAGEVNWDAAGLDGQPRRIENALKSGESVLVQVTKDPIGHKGARLTSQVSLPGRYLVYVPGSSMTGISRKLPDTERSRLKKILKEVVPEDAGVIVRTAAEGASESELRADVERLTKVWEKIQKKSRSASAPALLHGESEMTVRVIRDVFNEDFSRLVVAGERSWELVSDYVGSVAPDLADRLERWTGEKDLFTQYRVDEQIAKAMDRKVWLPSGGSLIIDRTEAMTVVDVNTGKFVGSGGNLEETVTKNNIEAAEEIVRQLRLRDIGGIIVVDFIDMVLEANRDLVVRRLLECLGRDRTKHQVAEVTSLGLVQMTRKRVGSGLIEVFSEPCEHCSGRGLVVHDHPVDKGAGGGNGNGGGGNGGGGRGRRKGGKNKPEEQPSQPEQEKVDNNGRTAAQIAAAAHAAAARRAQEVEEAVEADRSATQEPRTASAPASAPKERPAPEQPAAVTQPASEAGAAPEATSPSPVIASDAVSSAPAAQEPAPRRRKKRARVVAPAGAPGGSGGVPASGSDSASSQSPASAESPGAEAAESSGAATRPLNSDGAGDQPT